MQQIDQVRLTDFLANRGFTKIKLFKEKTGHTTLNASINGKVGRFILDTGAGATIIGEDVVSKFNVFNQKNGKDAQIADGTCMPMQKSEGNSLELGHFNRKDHTIMIMDISQINSGLVNGGVVEIDGILGADILSTGKAVLDYHEMALYLKS